MNPTGLLVVPVTGAETLALRSGRLPTGERVGIAFSTESRLIQVMGAGQRWIRLAEPTIKAMPAPLGIDRLQVDPGLIAPGVTSATPAPLTSAAPAALISAVPGPRTSAVPAPRTSATPAPLTHGRARPVRAAAVRVREPLASRELVKEFT